MWKLFLFLALGSSTLSRAASTEVQAGVESNFLVDGYRVRFAQSDGSLTTLSLSNGDILDRNRTRDFSGTLRSLPQGVLLLGSRSIVLLNPTNFSPRWDIVPGNGIFSNTIKDRTTLSRIRQYKPLVTFDNSAELIKLKHSCDTAGLVLRF